MAKFRLKSKITGEYIEITQEAIETPVEDIQGFYEGKDVETILTEIGMKIRNGVATPGDIELVKTMLDELNDEILDLKDGVGSIDGIDTEVLKSLINDYTEGNLGSGGTSGGIEGVDTEVLKEMIVKYLRGDFEKSLTPTIESTFPETTIIEEGIASLRGIQAAKRTLGGQNIKLGALKRNYFFAWMTYLLAGLGLGVAAKLSVKTGIPINS